MKRPKSDVIELPLQKDLPPGPTWRCMACGTRLRTGQPHSAVLPEPHYSIEVVEARQ